MFFQISGGGIQTNILVVRIMQPPLLKITAMDKEQRDLMNEAWRLFFEWLKENPEGGIFIYNNLTLEVWKR